MSDKIDDPLNIEEEFHSKEKKFDRKQRKILSTKDRSKFKKTDQDKLKKHRQEKPIEDESLKKGRVLAITPDGIIVEREGEEFLCSLKGVLKKEKTKKKNLIAVGDFVYFEVLDEQTGVILNVEDRFSILSRADNLRRRQQQLIATNIDQVLIVMSIFEPILKPSLIDRYIITAKKGNMKPVIVLNKIDLLKNPPEHLNQETIDAELELYKEFKSIYSNLEYPYLEVCAISGDGLDTLSTHMENKASVLSGQSGVGKTSLINAILGTSFKTKSVVQKTAKGSHTTTTARLIPIQGKGFCIDTPGIKSFGIWELSESDLRSYFKEFHKYSKDCKYPNCTHVHEPDCSVRQALDEGLISKLRYKSYLDLLESTNKVHKIR